jgi:hypothetical protein
MKSQCQRQSRRTMLRDASALGAALLIDRTSESLAAQPDTRAASVLRNLPEVLVSDSRLKVQFGEERMVLDDGLQPSMLCTTSGTLVVQSQLSKKPHPQKRIFYPYALETVVSRDGGQTWKEFPLPPGENGVNLEGGIIQLRDGTILALETYVTPGDQPGEGRGLLWSSNDDYRTLASLGFTFENQLAADADRLAASYEG